MQSKKLYQDLEAANKKGICRCPTHVPSYQIADLLYYSWDTEKYYIPRDFPFGERISRIKRTLRCSWCGDKKEEENIAEWDADIRIPTSSSVQPLYASGR